MKIISKYKDFYDYLWIDGDPDLVYVRKEKACFNLINELIKKDYSYVECIGGGIDRTYINYKPGNIDVIGYTFGIYPYVYTSPAIAIKMKDLSWKVKMLSKAEVDIIKKLKEEEINQYVKDILKEFVKGDEFAPDNIILNDKHFWRKSILNDINRFCWKKELPSLFIKLQSPVFTIYANEILDGVYDKFRYIRLDNKYIEQLVLIGDIRYTGDIHPIAITNICFNKLSIQVNKYWFDEINNLHTYSNIENFLMTSKLDPEPIISNDGKIIAHGFDLKTSFRKM